MIRNYTSFEGWLNYDVKSKRWRIESEEDGDWELSSGYCIDVEISGVWVPIRIEHNGVEYYAIPPMVRLLPGVSARLSS